MARENFIALAQQCDNYTTLYHDLAALQSELERRRIVKEVRSRGEEPDETDEHMPVFREARISFAGQDNSLLTVPVPITEKMLKMAATQIAERLEPVVRELFAAASAAVAEMEQAHESVRAAGAE